MKSNAKVFTGLFLIFLLLGTFSCGSGGTGGGVLDLLPPSSVIATAVSSQQINLTWLDQTEGEEGFKLERKIQGGEFQELSTMSPNSQQFSDVGLSASTQYVYRLRSFTSEKVSNYSNEATATTFTASTSTPLAPTLNSATALNSTSIKIGWTDNSNNELGFRIERSLGSGSGFAQIAEVGANFVEFTDTGLASTTEYFYRVRAYNEIGNSIYSSIMSASTFSSSVQGLMVAKIVISSDFRYGIDDTQMNVDNGKLRIRLLNDYDSCPEDPTVSVYMMKFDKVKDSWDQTLSNQTWDLFPAGTACTTGILSNEFDLRIANFVPAPAFNGIVSHTPRITHPTDMHSFEVSSDDVEIIYAYTADVSQISGYENLGIGSVYMKIDVPGCTSFWECGTNQFPMSSYRLYVSSGDLMLQLIYGIKPRSNPLVSTSHFSQLGWQAILQDKAWALSWTTDDLLGQVTTLFDCEFPDLVDEEFDKIIDLERYVSNVNVNLLTSNVVTLIADEDHTNRTEFRLTYVYTKN